MGSSCTELSLCCGWGVWSLGRGGLSSEIPAGLCEGVRIYLWVPVVFLRKHEAVLLRGYAGYAWGNTCRKDKPLCNFTGCSQALSVPFLLSQETCMCEARSVVGFCLCVIARAVSRAIGGLPRVPRQAPWGAAGPLQTATQKSGSHHVGDRAWPWDTPSTTSFTLVELHFFKLDLTMGIAKPVWLTCVKH